LKVLILGWTAPHSYETACASEFQRQGCQVLQIDDKPRQWWLGGRSWWNLTRAERLASDLKVSYRIYRAAKNWKPDVIFMCKAENIRAEVFTLLKNEIRCRLAIWYVDNPFNAQFSSYQALRHIQKSDFYFIWAKYLIDPLISAGAKNVSFLPFGYPSDVYEQYKIPVDEIEPFWRSDVSFLGTWDPDREQALVALANKEFDLAIYGQGWQTNIKPTSPLLTHVRKDSVWLGDVVKAITGSKITLNFLKSHNWKGHNLRTMEVTGIGGATLLTQKTEDQAINLFEENRDLVCYNGANPSEFQIKLLLENQNELRRISESGMQKVYNQHLLKHRINYVLDLLNK
jgi:spore maturation protein CgeB